LRRDAHAHRHAAQTGKTAVHEACSGGCADALRVLLQHGANADAVDEARKARCARDCV
jgi:ankyrin repeat protein